jgi:hypothetical protein
MYVHILICDIFLNMFTIFIYEGTEDNYQSVAFARIKTLTIMKGGLDECKPTWYVPLLQS